MAVDFINWYQPWGTNQIPTHWVHMLYLDDVSLPGHGDVSGVYWSRDHQILAVTSAFRLLTEPPARAAYGGHRLRYRLSLYRPPSPRPFAVFDDAVFPINDVSFHPTRPVVTLGTGTYDGGYMFEGQLVLWDWVASRSQALRVIPEVVRVRFSDDGSDLEAIVRPWNEGYAEGRGNEPFDMFFKVDLADVFDRGLERFDQQAISEQIDTQQPRSLGDVAATPHFPSTIAEPRAEIARALGIGSFRRRSPIWDVALVDADTVAVVHDDCLLQLFGVNGERRQSFNGDGHGVQILRARAPLIHITHRGEKVAGWSTVNATLVRLRDNVLSEVVSLSGRYTFSMAQNGSVLGRCDRSLQAQRESAKVDVILGSGGKDITRCDLGHYDVFNHHLRVDGAPYLFFVQGTPPSSHQAKYLCTVTVDGLVERLWPLLKDAGDQASHAMECCFCFIHDDHGSGMIVSGRHYNSSTQTPSGFIYRKNLDGRELWRHATTASAASIKVVPSSGVVMVAFLDGGFAMLHGDSGAVAHWEAFRLDGNASIIVSLDVDDTRVAIGTIDGRCGVMPLSEFMRAPFD